MKPFYERNGIIIYCGECSRVLAQFPDLHFNLTVTSPPYDDLREYLGYTFDFDAISGQLWRVTDKGGVVVWVVADQTKDGSESGTSFRQALGFMELGFNLADTMIYKRIPIGMRGSLDTYNQAFEYMFVFSRGKIKTTNIIKDRNNTRHGDDYSQRRGKNGKLEKASKRHIRAKTGRRLNVWQYNTGAANTTKDKVAFDHPAIFPEALARDHILSWSNPGDLVLDPMAGSGTVGKMALELGRRCVMIDVSEEYCKIMVERLRQPSFWSISEPAPESHQVDLREILDRGLE